jgi:hypothetical protein
LSNSLRAVTFDCADAATLAGFWADVLGRQVAEDPTPERAVLLPGDTSGLRIVFNKVPEPKTVKNRLHLDVISDTFDAETERLLSLGAPRGSATCSGTSHAGRPSPTSRATSST